MSSIIVYHLHIDESLVSTVLNHTPVICQESFALNVGDSGCQNLFIPAHCNGHVSKVKSVIFTRVGLKNSITISNVNTFEHAKKSNIKSVANR